MIWRYSYEILGGFLIVVSSWATEQMSDNWKKRAWGIFLIAAILYAGLGIYLDKQTAANEASYREEARQGQRDLQTAQKDNTEQSKNILARLDEIVKKPDFPAKQKQAASELKTDIQGPRFLTDARQQILADTLKAANGSIVRILTVGTSSEVQLFSDQITRAFAVSGWSVQSLAAGSGTAATAGSAGTTITSPVNVSCYAPAKNHAVEVVGQAFNNAKIDHSMIAGEPPYSGPMSWTSQLANPVLYIVIGSKA